MARKRPPQHRADTPGLFIPKSDPSFDRDRFDKEIERMKEDGLAIADHPVERYYSGKTRYDLDASDMLFGQEVCARSYFSKEAPEQFTLRRLDWAQWHQVAALINSGDISQGQLVACRAGVAAVENSSIKLQGAEAGFLTHADMQALHDADPALSSNLGFAVWMYSRPLSTSEKKA